MRFVRISNKALFCAAAVFLCGVIAWTAPALAIDGKDLLRLKKAGVEDETLAVIVREKALETAAVTVEEILELKGAGIGEETLRTVIREGSFLRDAEPIVYGEKIRTVRLATVHDVLELKRAGLDEKTIRAVIRAACRDAGEEERRRALDFLRDLDLRIDMRKSP